MIPSIHPSLAAASILAKCDSCGTCIKMCPVGNTALDWAYIEAGKAPRYNYDNCIRCYCCQELCPEGASRVSAGLAARMLRLGTR